MLHGLLQVALQTRAFPGQTADRLRDCILLHGLLQVARQTGMFPGQGDLIIVLFAVDVAEGSLLHGNEQVFAQGLGTFSCFIDGQIGYDISICRPFKLIVLTVSVGLATTFSTDLYFATEDGICTFLFEASLCRLRLPALQGAGQVGLQGPFETDSPVVGQVSHLILDGDFWAPDISVNNCLLPGSGPSSLLFSKSNAFGTEIVLLLV